MLELSLSFDTTLIKLLLCVGPSGVNERDSAKAQKDTPLPRAEAAPVWTRRAVAKKGLPADRLIGIAFAGRASVTPGALKLQPALVWWRGKRKR